MGPVAEMHVECVAPLSRGLKRHLGYQHIREVDHAGRMRCPAIEGIETRDRVPGVRRRRPVLSNALPRYRGD